jgi:phosphoglycerate dehydrogenase-like enzyme
MKLALNFDAPGIFEVLQGIAPDVQVVSTQASPAEWLDADILITAALGNSSLSDLIGRCTNLKWIHILGTGTDNFPLECAAGKMISCSRGATSVPIAEWVMATMLCFEKQLPERWINEPPQSWYMAHLGSLEGKTLGLVGLGSIGQAIARRALAFDMRIVAKVRQHRASPMSGVELLHSLEQVLAEADHLVLALPATAESKGLLGAEQLRQTKPGVHLVNVARAALIDQNALKPLLDSGHIGMASLDVVDPEPLPAGHWMYHHPRARLSPHISWSTPTIFDKMLGVFLNNLQAFRQGRPLYGVVDIRAGY